MKAIDFEDKIWKIERIRIVLRCPQNTDVGEYDYKDAASENISITEWLNKRVLPKLDNVDVEVIGGDGERPHSRSLLRTVRSSY